MSAQTNGRIRIRKKYSDLDGSATLIYSLNLFLSHNSDESYTPEKVDIHFNNKIKQFLFSEPEGFKELLIEDIVFDIFLVILSNHSDGKDSHVRILKVMSSPTEEIFYSNKWFDEKREQLNY